MEGNYECVNLDFCWNSALILGPSAQYFGSLHITIKLYCELVTHRHMHKILPVRSDFRLKEPPY